MLQSIDRLENERKQEFSASTVALIGPTVVLRVKLVGAATWVSMEWGYREEEGMNSEWLVKDMSIFMSFWKIHNHMQLTPKFTDDFSLMSWCAIYLTEYHQNLSCGHL